MSAISSITIADNSAGLGGSPGQFSGFDLDAIKLSTTVCATAACATVLAGSPVFNFSASGTFFTPGVQRAPADPKLFGTNLTGTQVDNAVATLGLLDANSTTGPGAFGFFSMGDGGILSFNLLSPVVSAPGLSLYTGEVGDNGEVAAGRIVVSDTPLPEPATVSLLGAGLISLIAVGYRRRG